MTHLQKELSVPCFTKTTSNLTRLRGDDEKQALELIAEFNKDPVENNVFETRLKMSGEFITVKHTFTAAWGEKPEDAVQGNFWKYLRNDWRKRYLSYVVESDPDSFAAYIAIRKATDSVGYHATWKPVYPGNCYWESVSDYKIGAEPPPRKVTRRPREKPWTRKAELD